MLAAAFWVPGDVITDHIFIDSDLLSGEYIDGITFERCSLEDLTIPETTFTNCTFIQCNFNNAYYNNVRFSDCVLKDCSMNKGLWSDTTLEDCKLTKCVFEDTTSFAGVELIRCELEACKWKDSYSTSDVFNAVSCIFNSNSFLDCILKNFSFNSCNFNQAVFSYCDISTTTFKDVSFDWAYFRSSDFKKTILKSVLLKNSRFKSCTFTDDVTIESVRLANISFDGTTIPEELLKGIEVIPIIDEDSDNTTITLLPNTGCQYTTVPSSVLALPPAIPQVNRHQAYRFFTGKV